MGNYDTTTAWKNSIMHQRSDYYLIRIVFVFFSPLGEHAEIGVLGVCSH